MNREQRRYAKGYLDWVDGLTRECISSTEAGVEARWLLQFHASYAAKVRADLGEIIPVDDKNAADVLVDVQEVPVSNTRLKLREALQAKLSVDKGEYEGISLMNAAALRSKVRTGSISVSGLSNFIFANRIPIPTGYKVFKPNKGEKKRATTLPTLEYYEVVNAKDSHDNQAKDGIVVHLPFSIGTNEGIPLPPGYEVVAIQSIDDEIDDEHFVLKPQADRNIPVTFNLDTPYQAGLSILIRKNDNEASGCGHYLPTPEERSFWSTVLPLPDDITARFTAGDKSAFMFQLKALFASEFRYICDDALGNVIARYNQDLPLIASTLRMGHCDLLSWTLAGYLRGLGIPAFTTKECVVVDDSDGSSAFKGALTHARVGVYKDSGGIEYFDPAAWCKVVQASSSQVDRLADLMGKSVDEADKMKAILSFREEVLNCEDRDLAISAARELGSFEDSDENRAIGNPFRTDNRSRLLALNGAAITEKYGLKLALQQVLAYCRRHKLRYYKVSDFSLSPGNENVSYSIANGTIAPDDSRLALIRAAKTADELNRQDIIFGVPAEYRAQLTPLVSDQLGHYLVLDCANISFSDWFKKFLHEVVLPNVGVHHTYEVNLDPTRAEMYEIEMFYFLQLVLQSDTNTLFLNVLKHDLALSNEDIRKSKSIVAPVGEKRALTVDIFDWARQSTAVDVTAKVLEVSQKELGLAVKKMEIALTRVLTAKVTTPNLHEWRLEEYSPDIHTPRDIHWKTTARLGKPIAKTVEQFVQRKEVLYVVSDGQDYWQLLVLLQAINNIQGRRNLDVMIQVPGITYKGHPCFVSLKAEKKLSIQQLQLVSQKLGGLSMNDSLPSEKFFLPQTKGKIKILALSDQDGDLASLKSQLQGKCDFAGVTWYKIGAAVFPTVRDSWVSES
jgi:hypothetical protein